METQDESVRKEIESHLGEGVKDEIEKGWMGKRRKLWSSYSELMSLLRAHLDAYCAPRGISYLLSRYEPAGCCEVFVTITGGPFRFAVDPKNEYGSLCSLDCRGNRSFLSTEALPHYVAIQNIVDSYNFHESDAMTDYFNQSFYDRVSFSKRLDRGFDPEDIPDAPQKSLACLRRDLAGKSVRVLKTDYVARYPVGTIMKVDKVKTTGFECSKSDGWRCGFDFGTGGDALYCGRTVALRSGTVFEIV
jgi:hypothetical protein